MSVAAQIRARTGLDRNPMRRRTDRVEAWTSLVLTVFLVILTPAAAWYAGHLTDQAGVRIEQSQRLARYPVVAQLLKPASYQRAKAKDGPMVFAAAAIWTAPDRTRHSGLVRARPGASAGTRQTVWTDTHGRIIGEPQSHSTTLSEAALAALLTVTVLGCAGAGIRALIRYRLDRQRLEQWRQEWEAIEPVWRELR